MKKYYAKRNGLLNQSLQISYDELLNYFYGIFKYFLNKGYFQVAFYGWYETDQWTSTEYQVFPPILAPNPEIFFTTELNNKEVWPIPEYYENYDEATLFTVIEILYDSIGIYDQKTGKYLSKDAKAEFVSSINNILKSYDSGYYLEPSLGYIMHIPNEALKEQLLYDEETLPTEIYDKLSTASKMYYRFNANIEEKKKAISILADILENEREELKEILNNEYEIPKNPHDKIIFEIVNNFNIRHNRADQKENYSKEIWYDWMMQYYTSVIITFYKLKLYHSTK